MKKNILAQILLILVSFFIFGCGSPTVVYLDPIACKVNGNTEITKDEKVIVFSTEKLFTDSYFYWNEFQNVIITALIEDGWTVLTTDNNIIRERVVVKKTISDKESKETTTTIKTTEKSKARFALNFKVNNRYWGHGALYIDDLKTGKLAAGVLFNKTTWDLLKENFMQQVRENIIVK